MHITLRLLLTLGLLSSLPFASCTCDPPAVDAGPTGAGRVVAVQSGDSVEIRLEGLASPLRTLQVDIAVSGAQAIAAESAGEQSHDLIDAALQSPRDELTLVIADTRRLLLTSGAVARVQLDASGTVELSHAVAVDDDGARVELEVEVR